MKKLSTYWKFQVIGWSIFTMVDVVLSALYLSLINDSAPLMYGRTMLVTILGVAVSHTMRKTIIALKVFQKPLFPQILYLLAITFCFSATFLGVWICIYYLLNLQNIAESTQTHFQIFYWVAYGFFGTLLIWNLIYFVYHCIQSLLVHEKEKITLEKELWEMEARALRAQMNPHFVFNCINSIKSFIRLDEEDKALNYLITLSKLIRIHFQNAGKKEVTLFDELETSRLYVQLESMGSDNKFHYHFEVDEQIDLKSIQITPLSIQPFIEDAIWHRLMPEDKSGKITVLLEKRGGSIACIIDNNGITEETIEEIKAINGSTQHEFKQARLTQSRLKPDISNQKNLSVEIINNKDPLSLLNGTKVILTFSNDDLE